MRTILVAMAVVVAIMAEVCHPFLRMVTIIHLKMLLLSLMLIMALLVADP
jgi:hypothetical protein